MKKTTKKRMSKAPSKAAAASKYLGSGGARNAAKAKISRQQRLNKALNAARSARGAKKKK